MKMPSDSSPTPTTMRVGAAVSASTSGRWEVTADDRALAGNEYYVQGAKGVDGGAAILLDDASFDGDAVRNQIVPLLTDPERVRSMADAAARTGIRTGAENVVALVDRSLQTAD